MIEASNRRMAFALLQEPYVGAIGRMRDYGGAKIFQNTNQGEGTIKAAIAVFDDELDVLQCPDLTTNNIIVVRIRTSAWEIFVVSFYFEPDIDVQPYLDQLKRIATKVGSGKIVIGETQTRRAPGGEAKQLTTEEKM